MSLLSGHFDDLTVDHIEFYVEDVARSAARLVTGYGFHVYGVAGDEAAGTFRSVALGCADILLVLTQGLVEEHPAYLYTQAHGDGVANIALRTGDARTAFETAVVRGARPVVHPTAWPGQPGFVTATIGAFGDVTHTFIQRPGGVAAIDGLPGFVPSDTPGWATDGNGAPRPALDAIDHLAVCLEAGGLAPTVEFYESALDFSVVFEERISVGAQAMLSQVVQSRSGSVTLTLIQPDPDAEAGQIDDFLKEHNGPGVQHIAFRTESIVAAVDALVTRGVEFLGTPGAYYDLLVQRLTLARYAADELKALNILVDEDHDGQLFQIFARSAHPRRTFFFEVIERLGARTFGSGNIRALYQAVETERLKAQVLS